MPRGGAVISPDNWSQMIEIARWGLGELDINYYGQTNEFSWSPDDQLLSIHTHLGVYLYDVATGSRTVSLPPLVDRTFLTRDIFVGTNGKKIWLFDTHDGTVIKTINAPGTDLELSLDGKRLAIRDDATIRIFDTKDWSQVQIITVVTPTCFNLSPDGEVIALMYTTETQFVSVETGKLLRSISHGGEINPNWTLFVSLPDASDTCNLFHMNENFNITMFGNLSGCEYNRQFSLSPDGKKLVNFRTGVYLFNDDKLQKVSLEGGVGYFFPTIGVFSTNSNKLVMSNGDDSVGIWDVQSGKLLQSIPNDFVISRGKLAFSPDGQLLAVEDDFDFIQIRNANYGKLVATLRQGNGRGPFYFSPDGSFLIDRSTILYYTNDWPQPHYYGPSDPTRPDAVSPDNQIQATTLLRKIILSQVSTKEVISEFQTPLFSWPSLVVFSPDGSYLAQADDHNPSIYLWKIPDGKLASKIPIHSLQAIGVNQLNFSQDGKYIAISYWDNPRIKVTVWDLSNNATVLETIGDQFTFSPDSSMFVVKKSCLEGCYYWERIRGGDYTFWRTENWIELGTITAPTVGSVSFSPDGRFFVVGGDIVIFYGIKP